MLTIGLHHYLCVAGALFLIGLIGVIVARRTLITMLMSLELMLLSVTINFVAFSQAMGDLDGQIFAFFILAAAAAEAAIGLALLLVHFRHKGSILLEDINILKG
jgi:NADH-quinone oxidoreductase subunit K